MTDLVREIEEFIDPDGECLGADAGMIKAMELLKRSLSALRWRDVNEELPEVGQQVFAKHQFEDGNYLAIIITYCEFGFPVAMFGEEQAITHWLPIPGGDK